MKKSTANTQRIIISERGQMCFPEAPPRQELLRILEFYKKKKPFQIIERKGKNESNQVGRLHVTDWTRGAAKGQSGRGKPARVSIALPLLSIRGSVVRISNYKCKKIYI